MQTLIASDDPATAERLRSALATHGVTCPVSRVVSLEAAAGTLAGGTVVDLVLVILSQDAERAIATVEQIRGKSRASVVVVGSARDPNIILRVVHAGPDDYLDIDGDFGSQLTRTLSRLKATLQPDTSDGRLITFVSHSGGAGCSFLAVNLAVALARLHSRSALCDFNLRRGDLATLLNLKPRFSITDVSRNVGRLDSGMIEQALVAHESGVHVLAAPSSLADVHPIKPEAADQIIRFVRASFPYIVADLEDFFHSEQLQLLKASSTVFFVMRLDFTALRNARRSLEYLEREGLDPNRIKVIVNQFGRAKEITVGQAEKVLDRKLSLFVPYDQRTVVSSLNRGIPVMWEVPKSKVGRAIGRIADSVSQTDVVAV